MAKIFHIFQIGNTVSIFHLGCGNEELNITAPLHSDKFALDEDCLKIGIEMEVRTVLKLLGNDL